MNATADTVLPYPPIHNQRLTAVLDGQQRLTALNIGLLGSMTWKRPRLWWNNPNAFPLRHLYVDLLWRPDEENEEGLKYRFAFRTNGHSLNREECWFPVRDILSMDSGLPMVQWLNDRLPQKQFVPAFETLDRLHTVVHKEPIISFYEENGQELDKVLQIFIRMNDGGTQLSHSDLLLSVAIAQWTQYDAREEIHSLVDQLNRVGVGFSFSKDLVLKAGLMLSDIGSVGFKVDNFNRENMDLFEGNWEDIKRALTVTVQLIAGFGFNGQNLTAHNAILPIAYYLYRKNPGESFLTHSRFAHDREAIHDWLVRSLLKSGVWGSGLDTLLTALRNVIRDGAEERFPVGAIRAEMARTGRSLAFEEEEWENLADMRYGDRLTFALLSLLFPFVDLRYQHHLDHIFPSSRFTFRRLREAVVPEDQLARLIQLKDGIANLQLLEGAENNEKRAMMPKDWLANKYPEENARREYRRLHLIEELPESVVQFEEFYTDRRTRLKEKIGQLLGR